MSQALSTREFLRRARQVHGMHYGYSRVRYRTMKHRVDIICPKHGLFRQIAEVHLGGSHCPQCAFEPRPPSMATLIRSELLSRYPTATRWLRRLKDPAWLDTLFRPLDILLFWLGISFMEPGRRPQEDTATSYSGQAHAKKKWGQGSDALPPLSGDLFAVFIDDDNSDDEIKYRQTGC